MKYYSKRGNLIYINSSKIINEIFYNIHKRDKDDIQSDFVFMMQEDIILNNFSEQNLLNLNVDIVPNAKKKRLQYNFENFLEMYEYLKAQHKQMTIFPYIGEDI